MPEMFQNEVEMLVYKGSPKIGSKINGPVYANDAVTRHANPGFLQLYKLLNISIIKKTIQLVLPIW
jgi:hypothetical protein